MTEIQNSMSALTKQIIDLRAKGHSLAEVASLIGIPVEDAVAEWQAYTTSYTVETKEEQWILHLIRLENLLVKVNRALEDYESIEDFETVLKLLDRIEALQSLNLSRKEEATKQLVVLSQQQGMLVMQAMLYLQENLKEHIDKTLRNKTVKQAKADLVDGIDGWFVQSAQKSLEKVAAENDK